MGKSKDLASLGGGSFSKSLTINGSANDTNILTTGFNYTNLSILADATDGELRLSTEDGSGNNYTKYMTFYTEGGSGPTERMRIDASGRVTMPYQPAFYVSDGDSLQTSNLKNCNNVHVNVGNGWNNSTGVYTAPVSGIYFLSSGVLVNAGSGRVEGWIQVNGANKINYNGTGTTYDGAAAAAVVSLAANDTVTLVRTYGTVYNDGGHPNTYLSGYLLG